MAEVINLISINNYWIDIIFLYPSIDIFHYTYTDVCVTSLYKFQSVVFYIFYFSCWFNFTFKKTEFTEI